MTDAERRRIVRNAVSWRVRVSMNDPAIRDSRPGAQVFSTRLRPPASPILGRLSVLAVGVRRGGRVSLRSPTLYPTELWAHFPAEGGDPTTGSPTRGRASDPVSDASMKAESTGRSRGGSVAASATRNARKSTGRGPTAQMGEPPLHCGIRCTPSAGRPSLHPSHRSTAARPVPVGRRPHNLPQHRERLATSRTTTLARPGRDASPAPSGGRMGHAGHPSRQRDAAPAWTGADDQAAGAPNLSPWTGDRCAAVLVARREA